MAESYRRWRLPELWEMLAADNAEDAHLHLATLRRQQTALETQRDRLRVLRDQLAEAWPPDKSEAAAVFEQQINDMIDAMAATARGAAELRTNLVHVVDAIGRARNELEPLVADYNRAQAATDPRVARHAQRILDDRARAILVGADATVVQALGRLNVPLPDYSRFSWDRQEEQGTTQSSTTGASTGSAAGGRKAGGGLVASPARYDLSPLEFHPPSPSLAEEEFGLAGLHDVGNSPDGIGGASGSGERGTRAFTGLTDSPSGGLVLRGPIESGSGSDAARTVIHPAVGRPIGGGPASGVPMSAGGGRFAPAIGSSQRAPSITSHSSASTTSARRLSGGSGGHRDHSFENYVERRRAPRDDQGDVWSVNEGVVPLITAPSMKDRHHDPGPGVLGIDR